MKPRKWEHLNIKVVIDNQEPIQIQQMARWIKKIRIKGFMSIPVLKFSKIQRNLEHQPLDGEMKREWSALIVSFISLAILREINLLPITEAIDWAKLKRLQIWRWLRPYNGRRYGMRHIRRWIFEAIQGRSFAFATLPYSAYHHPEDLHFWIRQGTIEGWNTYQESNQAVYDIF